MTLGNWNKNKHLDNFEKKYINVSEMDWSRQFHVPLTQIKVDNLEIQYNYERMNSSGGSAFLDSGTTFVYFSHNLYNRMKSTLVAFCSKKKENCGGFDNFQECYPYDKTLYPNKYDLYDTFPTINFNFDGVDVDWYPHDYLANGENLEVEEICYGIKPLRDAILGAIFMKNYDFYLDKVNQRVGFIRSNCGDIDRKLIYPKDKNLNDNNSKILIQPEKDPQTQPSSINYHYNQSIDKNAELKSTVEERMNSNNLFIKMIALLILVLIFITLLYTYRSTRILERLNRQKNKKVMLSNFTEYTQS